MAKKLTFTLHLKKDFEITDEDFNDIDALKEQLDNEDFERVEEYIDDLIDEGSLYATNVILEETADD